MFGFPNMLGIVLDEAICYENILGVGSKKVY